MKIDEIRFAHITNLKKKEILPLYMVILSSNEDTNHLNVCHISLDFNEENLYNKQTCLFLYFFLKLNYIDLSIENIAPSCTDLHR
jgi:hypothetical protein